MLISDEIEKYIEAHSSSLGVLYEKLERETYVKVLQPHMLSGKVQGNFLKLFSTLLKPKRILEIGTFTGFSALCLAEGLAENGILYTLEGNEEIADFAQRFFDESPLKNNIKLILGDAKKTIETIDEKFQLIFIDADKQAYAQYYDLVFPKLEVGGIIIADNILWKGKIAASVLDKDTKALDDFNKKVQADTRVENVILSVRDGLMIVKKIKE